MGIEQVLTSARSPWQNPYVERLIGSIRRECLDHTIIFGENHLRRVLRDYFNHYHESRTHLGLGKDCPESRPVEPPDLGPICAEPMVGGLHHRYFRRKAPSDRIMLGCNFQKGHGRLRHGIYQTRSRISPIISAGFPPTMA